MVVKLSTIKIEKLLDKVFTELSDKENLSISDKIYISKKIISEHLDLPDLFTNEKNRTS